MDKKIVVFDRIPHPKTINEHESIGKQLAKREEEEHEMISMIKATEIMDKYKNEGVFILTALQER
jgi:hypothetical protein